MDGGNKMLKSFLGLALLFLFSFAAQAEEGTGPQVGKPAPNLIGRTLDDQPYMLKKDKGSPKVINFFAVTCKPCRVEMPELAKFQRRFKGVKFISVHALEENPAIVEKFVKSLSDAPSNIVVTEGGLQESFNYLGLPHTIVLDSNNIVLMNLVGYTQENMLNLGSQLQKMEK
jgi:thiol-disulfide isomerase/thioredoxin